MSTDHINQLIASLTELNSVFPDCQLIPCDIKKQPAGYHRESQSTRTTPADLKAGLKKKEIIRKCPNPNDKNTNINKNIYADIAGYKLLTGYKVSYQCQQVLMVALDVDGDEGQQTLDQLLGDRALPSTVAWSSGKQGRCTHLFYVPVRDDLDTKAALGIKDGKVAKVVGGKLEIIAGWPGVVLPPSKHPETDGYKFLPGRSFKEIRIAQLPDYLLQFIVKQKKLTWDEHQQTIPPYPFSMPLFDACRVEVRDWISQGVAAKDGHNNVALEVTNELLGVAEYLDRIGQEHDDPQYWYEVFLTNSGVNAGSRELNRLTHTEKKSWTCVEDSVNTSVRAYYWTHVLKRDGRALNTSSKQLTKEQTQDIFSELKTLYNTYKDVIELEVGLSNIASKFSINRREIERLYQSVISNEQSDQHSAIAGESFKELLKNSTITLKLNEILPPELARELEKEADGKCHPLRYLTYLWPAAATLIGGKVRVQVDRLEWFTDLIFYTVDIGLKGSAKTPAAEDIMFYIEGLEVAASNEAHNRKATLARLKREWRGMSREQKEHHAQDANVNPDLYEEWCATTPIPIFRFDSPTIPAIIKYLAPQHHYHAAIMYADELTSLFAGMNQFKNGDGNDRQFWLEWFNKRSFKRLERKAEGSSGQLRGQIMNLSGGMQPEMFRKYMSLCKSQDGFTDRFLICDPPPIPVAEGFKVSRNAARASITHTFNNLRTISVPDDQRITLSYEDDAFEFWERCLVTLKQIQYEQSTINPDFSGYCSKLITYYSRLAGVLSLIWDAYYLLEGGQLEPKKIPLHIAKKTWCLIVFYAAQYLKIQSLSDEESNPKTVLMADIWKIVSQEGSITPRTVVQRFAGRKTLGKVDTAFAKQILLDMAANGYGVIKTVRTSIALEYAEPVLVEQQMFKLRELPTRTQNFNTGDIVTVLTGDYAGQIAHVYDVDYVNKIAFVDFGSVEAKVHFKHLQLVNN